MNSGIASFKIINRLAADAGLSGIQHTRIQSNGNRSFHIRIRKEDQRIRTAKFHHRFFDISSRRWKPPNFPPFHCRSALQPAQYPKRVIFSTARIYDKAGKYAFGSTCFQKYLFQCNSTTTYIGCMFQQCVLPAIRVGQHIGKPARKENSRA